MHFCLKLGGPETAGKGILLDRKSKGTDGRYIITTYLPESAVQVP